MRCSDLEKALHEANRAFDRHEYQLAIDKHPEGHPRLKEMGEFFLSNRYFLLAIKAFEKANDNEGLIKTGNMLIGWENYYLASDAFKIANHYDGLDRIVKITPDPGLARDIHDYLASLQQII